MLIQGSTSYAHAVTVEPCAELPRSNQEVVAESLAYAVCSRFGLDLSLRSAGDVARCLDDPDGFKTGMAAIYDGAASLIDAVKALLPGPVALDLAA